MIGLRAAARQSLRLLGRATSGLPLDDVLAGGRLLSALPGFLSQRIDVDDARAILRQRLERRGIDFLALVRRSIYGYERSPYRQLLRLAGCEYGDLEQLVHKDGLDDTLRVLLQRGVYLTLEEFKGRRPVVRGSTTFSFDPLRLRNPGSAAHVWGRTSGSTGKSTPIPVDLAGVADVAVNMCLTLDARGGIRWSHAIWGVPGSATLIILLAYSRFGAITERWFSQLDPGRGDLHPRYRWSTRAIRWGSILAGTALPAPVYVQLENPLQIVRWMESVLRAGRTPHLNTLASSAVRVSQAALRAGVDLRGAHFTMGGEPTTAGRRAAVLQAGGSATPSFGSSETGGRIAFGCSAPTAPDDLHFFHDLHALVQPQPDQLNDGLTSSALLLSSLRKTAPLIMLNVSLGDRAFVEQRACGCPLEHLGWTTHLHGIRSFEKLNASGIPMLDADVLRVLEEVLPRQFGGQPTDYQVLEEEAENGGVRLRLLVHPSLGPLDDDAVADAFLAALGGGSGLERVRELNSREARLLQVERRPPLTTEGGKILHLHQQRSGARETQA